MNMNGSHIEMPLLCKFCPLFLSAHKNAQQMPGYYFKQKSLGYQPGFFLISNQFTLTKAKILTFLT